ncbi:MAG: hypothetical protein ACI9BO_000683 [Zhongshania sp.]|jgi:hypothetical protein
MKPVRTKVQQATPLCMGQLLLSGGFIKVGVLNQALCTQKWSRRRLGDELEQHYALGNIEKKTVLRLQKTLAKQSHSLNPDGSLPESLQLTLGQLLLDNGEITHEQLDSALAEHKRSNRRLGEVLVEQQTLSSDRLSSWLQLQKKLISAASMAVFMSAASGAVTADETQQSGWQKFISTKILQAVSAPSKLAWGQQQSGNKLARISVKNRDFSELSRSRDGTLTLSFGQKGLNVMKRF